MNPIDPDSQGAPADDAPPFAGLTPERVLDALDSVLIPVGTRTDGRLLPLNSYENRVYQVGVEDGAPVVAKFYRPERWSNTAILEEHAFVASLVEREIPAVPARVLEGATLHEFDGFRFSVFERRGGRAPDLDHTDTLEWLGRFIGRIHAVGGLESYRERPTLDIETFGYEPRDFLLTHGFIPADVREAWETVVSMALEGVAQCFDRAGDVRHLRLHGDCHPSNVLWTDAGPISSISTIAEWVRRFRIYGCCCPPDARTHRARSRICSPATKISASSISVSCIWWKPCARSG